MKLCTHGHAMTPENTGYLHRDTYHSRTRKIALDEYCKQCRRDAYHRWKANGGKRKSRTKQRKADYHKDEATLAQLNRRIPCGFPPCRATAETEAGIAGHERRFHARLW